MNSPMHIYISYILCLIFGVICVICVVYWNFRWRGGFSWDGSALQFNWHPVMMVTGLVVLYGMAAVLFRLPWTRTQDKQSWKLLHGALMFLAMVLCVMGLCAAFDFHSTNHIPNLYSLHSWVGISTATLFVLQWLLGLAIFVFPCCPGACHKLLKPVHIWMGSMIFIMAIASCFTGINEKLIFISEGQTNVTLRYSALPSEAVFANTLGVLITAFGLLVLKILFNQRAQLSEEGCDENTPLLSAQQT